MSAENFGNVGENECFFTEVKGKSDLFWEEFVVVMEGYNVKRHFET